jgi:hypothetical protein
MRLRGNEDEKIAPNARGDVSKRPTENAARTPVATGRTQTPRLRSRTKPPLNKQSGVQVLFLVTSFAPAKEVTRQPGRDPARCIAKRFRISKQANKQQAVTQKSAVGTNQTRTHPSLL